MSDVGGTTQKILEWYAAAPWIGLLILAMALDMLSGIIAAMVERRLSSKIGYRGVLKKVAMLLVIGTGIIIELAILNLLPEDMSGSVSIPIAKLTAGFFFCNEILSVLENAKKAGVPMPAFLTRSLIDTMNKISNMGGDGYVRETVVSVQDHLVERVNGSGGSAGSLQPDLAAGSGTTTTGDCQRS